MFYDDCGQGFPDLFSMRMYASYFCILRTLMYPALSCFQRVVHNPSMHRSSLPVAHHPPHFHKNKFIQSGFAVHATVFDCHTTLLAFNNEVKGADVTVAFPFTTRVFSAHQKLFLKCTV
jgi:hypothetical protein